MELDTDKEMGECNKMYLKVSTSMDKAKGKAKVPLSKPISKILLI